ncbi:MAG: prepilin peptidase [Abditibacteriota bacterium]|nr:prepilin peptidase [Abditibacteriota bacterium]MBP5092942.1 prepilin peptidase [Abditibacteriota bacterium]MBP5737651.1 prepilin peptidase [Abditibacteriota bacterium]
MLVTTVCVVIMFCLGCAIGSFLNVCIYRLPIGESVVRPPSHCPNCDTRLRPADLVPLFSYLFLGRKCRYCKTPISPRYFTVELLVGLLFAGAFYVFGPTVELLFCLVFVTVLTAGAFIDIDHMIIPDSVVVTCLLCGLAKDVYHYFVGDLDMVGITPGFWLFPSFVGALLCGGLFYLLAFWGDLFLRRRYKDDENYEGALGLGDVSLAAGIGAVLGYFNGVLSFFFAVVFGAVFGMIQLIAARRRGKKAGEYNPIPFGPYMVLGVFFVLYFSPVIARLARWWLGLL